MTKVTIQRDICLNLVVPLTATHDFIPMPPFPPVPPPLPGMPLSLAAAAIEVPVNAWWPPGVLLKHKFTDNVLHAGMKICLDGHDCGWLIPHVQVTPAINNILTLMLHIPLSSRKANFSAATVVMNGKPVACMTMIAWPPTPMTYCADPINMPLADAPTSHFNTVEVGVTLGDWLIGAFGIAANMILDYALFKWKGGTRNFGQRASRRIAQSRAKQAAAKQGLKDRIKGTVTQAVNNQLTQEAKSRHLKTGIRFGAGQLVGLVQTGLRSPGGPFLGVPGSPTVSRATGPGGPGSGGPGRHGSHGRLDTGGAGLHPHHPAAPPAADSPSEPYGGFERRRVTPGPEGPRIVPNGDPPSSLPHAL